MWNANGPGALAGAGGAVDYIAERRSDPHTTGREGALATDAATLALTASEAPPRQAATGAEATFARWQPKYAERGVATFPVAITDAGDKKPATSGYLKTGLRGSTQLAIKFAEARSFGFACGPRNRITVIDMDDRDPAIVKEGERLFGASPLLWRTGGGKYAMPFRHNDEGRRIRPIPSLPIDLLGGGFVVAPPSAGAIRPYEIIRGTLADLDRLPVARIPEEIARKLVAQAPTERVPDGRRHVALFEHCRSIVGYCDTLDQLIDATTTWATDRLDPLPSIPHADIVRTCVSVWDYRGGRRKIMNNFVESSQFASLVSQTDALALFAYLSAENGPNSEFMIADGLAEARGWPRRFVPSAREVLLNLGLIERIGRRGKTGPWIYRWRTLPPP